MTRRALFTALGVAAVPPLVRAQDSWRCIWLLAGGPTAIAGEVRDLPYRYDILVAPPAGVQAISGMVTLTGVPPIALSAPVTLCGPSGAEFSTLLSVGPVDQDARVLSPRARGVLAGGDWPGLPQRVAAAVSRWVAAVSASAVIRF